MTFLAVALIVSGALLIMSAIEHVGIVETVRSILSGQFTPSAVPLQIPQHAPVAL